MPEAQKPQLLQDGYTSYSGGCHAAATNPRELAENQLAHIVNGTVRGGFLTPRDGYAQIQIKFSSAEDRKVFETGRFQGEEFYGETSRIVYVIDGRIFSVDPVSGKAARHAASGQKQPLSAAEPFAWLEERDGYVVCSDGVNRTVILDRFAARRCEPLESEIPACTVMADGWGRLMIVNPGRNRVYFSDHELDPESESHLFTEQTDYYLAAEYFQPPRKIGAIMAAEFIPVVDAPLGLGPLLVVGKRGAVTYDVSIPRVDGGWIKNQIERLTLLNIGTCGHRTVMAVDNDVIFRDQHGRLRTLSQTIRDQEQRKNAQRVRRFDREVSPWIKRETAWLRQWSDVSAFDDRYLFTVLADSTILPGGRRDVWHRGVLAFNLDVLGNVRGAEEPVWDGLLTGLRVQAITSGSFGDVPRLYLLSRDSDGIRRLYEQRPGLTHDLARSPGSSKLQRKRIEWQAGYRWFDFKSPFLLKKLVTANLRIGNIKGTLEIEAFVRRDAGPWLPWWQHCERTAECIRFGLDECGHCGFSEQEAGEQERVVLPSLLPSIETFFRLQIMLRITGWCELRELLLEASPEAVASRSTSVAACPKEPYQKDADVWQDLTYDVITAKAEP